MLRECKQRLTPCGNPQKYDERDPKTGEVVLLPVDCFSYQPALVNPCGFPMNDVYAYEHAASDSVAETILRRMDLRPDVDANKDMPIEQKIEQMVPRNWCSPAEYLRYTRGVAEKYYKREQARKAAEAASKETIDFTNDDVKSE